MQKICYDQLDTLAFVQIQIQTFPVLKIHFRPHSQGVRVFIGQSFDELTQ